MNLSRRPSPPLVRCRRCGHVGEPHNPTIPVVAPAASGPGARLHHPGPVCANCYCYELDDLEDLYATNQTLVAQVEANRADPSRLVKRPR